MLNPILSAGTNDSTVSWATQRNQDASLESAARQVSDSESDQEFRKTFDQFVGQTLFGSLLKELRKSEQGAAYLNGGQAEKVFRGQLDQVLVERMSDASAKTLTGPMYDLMMANRRM
jgi:hypothetical protein